MIDERHAGTGRSVNHAATPSATVRGLVKSFGGKVVLGPIDLDIFPGEFVALLGHNGAGKSTLLKVLDGVYSADAGEVYVGGTRGRDGSVGVVHQELGLIDELTVLENVRLGQVPSRTPMRYLDRRSERAAAQDALDQFGLDHDLDQLVADLAPSERALLAVARVAATKPKLIVLDETTSVLSSGDANALIAVLREKSPADIAFVMVTHKLQEALDLATRVVVLRDGQMVCDRNVPLPSVEEVTDLLAPGITPPRRAVSSEAAFSPDVLLEMVGVRLGNVGPLNLSVRRGECVAITGQAGSTLPTVGHLAAGVLTPEFGCVDVEPGVRRAIVPPSREREGTLPNLTVRENVTLGNLATWTKGPFLSLVRERDAVAEIIESLGVLPADDQAEQGTLSGGNQQKVIFCRTVLSRADVLVLCEPTRGVDVATRRQIYDLMEQLKASGCALLVVASDPQDVLATSDRILIMRDGLIESEYDAKDITSTELAQLV
jgi:ribose transport system ATP-binding protein